MLRMILAVFLLGFSLTNQPTFDNPRYVEFTGVLIGSDAWYDDGQDERDVSFYILDGSEDSIFSPRYNLMFRTTTEQRRMLDLRAKTVRVTGEVILDYLGCDKDIILLHTIQQAD